MGNVSAGVKVLTHDGRSPIRLGPSVWDGVTLPYTLPTVVLDTGPDLCAAGWNYSATLSQALLAGGLWADGRPARAVYVEASPDAVERGQRRRASSLTIVREATDFEIEAAIYELSAAFGPRHLGRMADEQYAWWIALGRRRKAPRAVEAALKRALAVRGFPWSLQQCTSENELSAVQDVSDAWDAGATHGAWKAGTSHGLMEHAPEARIVLIDAWRARKATGSAWDARAALTVYWAAVHGWVALPAYLLTTGIRAAYANGLGQIRLTLDARGRGVLSWAMDGVAPRQDRMRRKTLA